MGDRTYSFDANMVLSDNAAPYTATGFAQANGADGILDLGGNQFVTPLQQARMDGVVVIDVTAFDATTTDEAARLLLLGSNDPAFGNGSIQVLAEIELAGGVLSVLGPGAAGVTKTATVGRYELPFCSEQNSVKYEYVKMFNVLSGTTPSISYSAFIAVLPEP